MLTYAHLSRKPAVFQAMTGLRLPEFETVFTELEPLAAATAPPRRSQKPRRRRRGAGHPFKHLLRDRLLMTLMWLRLYPTYEALGVWFSLDQSNVWRTVDRLQALLLQVTAVDLVWPVAGQRKRELADLIRDFPEVQGILDSTEQRIRRPKAAAAAAKAAAKQPKAASATAPEGQGAKKNKDPYYSGKKKTHTVKTQITVAPDGRLRDVSETAPGSVHDLTLLRQTGLLQQVAADEALMGDGAYQGAADEARGLGFYHPYKAAKGRPLTAEEEAYNRRLGRARVVVEHTLAQLKRFQCLAQGYRQHLKRYNRMFRIVAGLTNRQLVLRPLLAC